LKPCSDEAAARLTRGNAEARAVVTPRVSVAMATCNGERWLDAQLDSILAQLASDDELVIVDDASTDSTRERIAARADARIRLTANATNLGVRASFERALTLVRGEFIFLADQDDVWLPDKRAALVEELESGALLALGDATVIDGEGRAQASSFMAWRGGFRGSFTATLWKNRYLGARCRYRRTCRCTTCGSVRWPRAPAGSPTSIGR
jgi:glycosyltransferase involved in cell wall biosynthesis